MLLVLSFFSSMRYSCLKIPILQGSCDGPCYCTDLRAGLPGWLIYPLSVIVTEICRSFIAFEDTTNGGISSLLLNAKAGWNCGGIARGMRCTVQSRDLKHLLAVRPGSVLRLTLSLLQDPRVWKVFWTVGIWQDGGGLCWKPPSCPC